MKKNNNNLISVLKSYESHGGEDVPVYAIGAYSELFTGVFEQSYIPWAMTCAGGLHEVSSSGSDLAKLRQLCPDPSKVSNAAATLKQPNIYALLSTIILLYVPVHA